MMKFRAFLIIAATVFGIGCNTFVDANTVGPQRSATCGDGALQADEKCDPSLPEDSIGACPSDCDDGVACTADTLIGSADTCDAVCSSVAITECANNDGCCAPGCDAQTDTDCDEKTVCGDGIRTGAETCDSSIESGQPDACPLSPDDCPVQTGKTAIIAGAAQNCDAACAYIDITTCVDGDDFCPPGCDLTSDADCEAMCGNMNVEPGETCDGNCPPADCDDGRSCTSDSVTEGSPDTCDIVCENVDITACVNGDGCCAPGCDSTTDADCSADCGNMTLDQDETCDPSISSPDPGAECADQATCDALDNDGDACTFMQLEGSASSCDAECIMRTIIACGDADGCCPASCNANNDPDCQPSCGNGVVESGETCDGNCPTSCSGNGGCTTYQLQGESSMCNVECVEQTITSCSDNDNCCATGCNETNDNDCLPNCGNGVVETGEVCDGNCPTCTDADPCTIDGQTGSPSTCDVVCTQSTITQCVDNDMCCPSSGSCSSANDNDCNNCMFDQNCGDTEACVNGLCVVAKECSEANDPRAWCVAFASGATECLSGECYHACSPAGPEGACSCPDPDRQACFQKNNVVVCQTATVCGQLCDTGTNRDDWCSEVGGVGCSGATCQ